MKDKELLKKIVPYLPYGLKFMLTCDWSEDFDLDEINIPEKDLKEGSIWELSVLNCKKELLISVGGGDLEAFILSNNASWISISDGCKPILRPLSDLTKVGEGLINEHSINMLIEEKFKIEYGVFCHYKGVLSIELDGDSNVGYDQLKTLDFKVIDCIREELLKAHFDVFGLIEQGKAIDINTINKR